MKIIKSVIENHNVSILEMTIYPNTGNPNHFHTLFDETFEIVYGELVVTHNKRTTVLKKGEIYKIEKGDSHSFKNCTIQECKIKITLEPGNRNFEKAMKIYYGLKSDGLIYKNGNPKRIKDLAVFVYINNSNMSGFGFLIQKLLTVIAIKSIKNGYLNKLEERYV